MTATIDQQFIEYIVKSLVGHPDEVQIERTIDEKGVLLELTVNPDDLGRVIGKRGATAQSLRTLLRALGTKNDARYNLKIIDNGDGSHRTNDDSSYATTSSSDEPQDDVPTHDVSAQDDVSAAPVNDDYISTLADSQEEADHSDVVSRARAELADLDDLDL